MTIRELEKQILELKINEVITEDETEVLFFNPKEDTFYAIEKIKINQMYRKSGKDTEILSLMGYN